MTTPEKRTCVKCKKTQKETNFYKSKTASEKCPDLFLPVCKDCLENIFKSSEPQSFMSILKLMDVPWIPSEYRTVYNKNIKPACPNKISLLGKYLMKMKLKQYREYGFMESQAAQEKYESEDNYDSIENYNYNLPIEDPISVNSLSTSSSFYIDTVISEPSGGDILDREAAAAKVGNSEQVDNNGLTIEEVRYLTFKWGRSYHIDQMLTMERTYQEMCEDFDIRTSGQKNYLRKYCQASLRYDECLSNQDFNAAKQASAMFTSINKEAGFQPIQNKGASDNYLNAVSYLVKLAEEPGPIPKFDIYADPDIVDISIMDIKKWQRDLVKDDDTIMDRFAIAKEQLEEQDALVKNGLIGIDENGPLANIDMSVYDSLNVVDFSDGKETGEEEVI